MDQDESQAIDEAVADAIEERHAPDRDMPWPELGPEDIWEAALWDAADEAYERHMDRERV